MKLWSNLKIHIDYTFENDQKIPNVGKGSDWYVQYSFRNPDGKMQVFKIRRGINRIKNIAERKKAASNLKKGVLLWLQEGGNPFVLIESRQQEIEQKVYSVNEALDLAYQSSLNTWKQSTITGNNSHLKKFKTWLSENSYLHDDIKNITKKHISFYLDYLTNTKKLNNTSRNNARALLSSLFTQMAIKDVIEYNFFENIPKVKAQPKKNRPFTFKMLIAIFDLAKKRRSLLTCFFTIYVV